MRLILLKAGSTLLSTTLRGPPHLRGDLRPMLMAAAERAGAGGDASRASRPGRAGGRLELGAGTGLNLAHYASAVTELVLTEPDPHMARRLRRRLQDEPPAPARVEVVEAPAERLPFEDGSFDSVVSTLVLCSVETPAAATGEIVRVLKPDGRLLYLEHVRADDDGLARWQDRLERPWGSPARAATPTGTRSRSFKPRAWRPSRSCATECPRRRPSSARWSAASPAARPDGRRAGPDRLVPPPEGGLDALPEILRRCEQTLPDADRGGPPPRRGIARRTA